MHDTRLVEFLAPHCRIHRQRLVFVGQLVVSLILVRTVNWTGLANAVDSPGAGSVGSAAYRRIQGLFGWIGLSQDSYVQMVLGLVGFGDRKLTLVLDRTEWKLGQRPLQHG